MIIIYLFIYLLLVCIWEADSLDSLSLTRILTLTMDVVHLVMSTRNWLQNDLYIFILVACEDF